MFKVMEKKTTQEKFKNKRKMGASQEAFDLNQLMNRKMAKAGSITKLENINYAFFTILKNNL